MGERSKAERFGNALDRMLGGEQVAVEDGDLTSLLELARRLKQEAPAHEPDPEYVARLREDLLGVEAHLSDARSVGNNGRVHGPFWIGRHSKGVEWWWRLAAACAALFVVALVIWLGAGRKGTGEVNGDLARLPSLLKVASAYAEQAGEDVGEEIRRLLGNVTFQLAVPLPKVPNKAKIYRQVPESIDRDGAVELARRLGIAAPSVVDEPDYGVFIATDEGGRLVVSKTFRGYFSFDTKVEPGADPLVPAPMPPSVAPLGAIVTPALAPLPLKRHESSFAHEDSSTSTTPSRSLMMHRRGPRPSTGR